MIIKDRIYGDIEITNPLIVDLINSKPLQRLKHISQDGAAHFIDPIFNATRFEHSVGAWYLSFRYNRPIEEQIACLLHDVPHTAFSHVIDFVVENANQEYHDGFTKKIVLESEIPEVCKKYGVDIQKVLRKEDFYLLDNRTPELSVDRWDYLMRDGYMIGVLPKATIDEILKDVKVKNEEFYFQDLRLAALFSIMSMNIARLCYLCPNTHGSYFLLANAIKIALKKKIITESEFFKTDTYVFQKLKNAHQKEIDGYLHRLKKGKNFEYAPKKEAEFYGKNKARYVDPLVLQDGGLKKVSELIPGLAGVFEEFKEKYKYIGVKQSI